MKTLNNIKDLDVTLDELYKGQKQVEILISDKPYTFNLVLTDRVGFDCKLSSFGANLYFRTRAGVNFLQYKSLGILQREIVKILNQKLDANGNITFVLSDEVYTF